MCDPPQGTRDPQIPIQIVFYGSIHIHKTQFGWVSGGRVCPGGVIYPPMSTPGGPGWEELHVKNTIRRTRRKRGPKKGVPPKKHDFFNLTGAPLSRREGERAEPPFCPCGPPTWTECSPPGPDLLRRFFFWRAYWKQNRNFLAYPLFLLAKSAFYAL